MGTTRDKVAKLSFIALLVTVTAAMFYAPTAPQAEQALCKDAKVNN